MSSKTQLILKRLIDILLSFIGLVLLAVPFAIIAVAIKLDSKGSVFFRQERVGIDGQSFKVWKFRTIVVGHRGLVKNNECLARNSSKFKLRKQPINRRR